MPDCECLVGCVFFNDQMANMPMTAETTKELYCRGDSSRCARYQVFKALGRGRVPADLFPNEVHLVGAILAGRR